MRPLSPEQRDEIRAIADDPTADTLERARALKLGMEYWTELLREVIEDARRENRPWVEIAVALGVSRQAASRRFTVRAVEDP